jgi:lysophospholipase L1-like esterase
MAVVALIGALTVVVASQPASPPERAVSPVVSERGRVDSTSVDGRSGLRPSPVVPSIGEPGRPPTDRIRPDVPIPVPSPLVALRMGAGAKAVFLGDSYTTGWNGAGTGARGWPARVAKALGLRTVNLAVAGTGFVNPGWTGQPIGSRVSAAIRAKPDIVFIAGGHNDWRWPATTTAKAADAAIDRLHRALPDAVLVIVAPIWASGAPPTRCLVLRDRLRRTAHSLDAIFIDPLADRWFAGSRQLMIGPDGVHPTNAGYRYIADRVLEGIAGAE